MINQQSDMVFRCQYFDDDTLFMLKVYKYKISISSLYQLFQLIIIQQFQFNLLYFLLLQSSFIIIVLNFLLNMELQKQQYLETFLNIVRGSKTKNQFLKNVQQFDNKFTEIYQGPSFQNKASLQSFSSVSQLQAPQKPKNPFINTFEQSIKRNNSPLRANNFIQSPHANYGQTGNLLSNNQNKVNIPHSRSQQQFFKQQSGSKTYNEGFGLNQNQINRPLYQQLNKQQPKNNNSNWQANDSYNPYSNNNLQVQQRHYGDMLKNFGNLNVTQHQKYMNSNDMSVNNRNQLSINSNQHYNQIGSNIDPYGNQYLANMSQDEPDFVKYYKRLVPVSNKVQNMNQRPFIENRMNPFGNH